ncbi:MAG: HAD-IIIA family hydrolase [Fibrobacterota bacterium]
MYRKKIRTRKEISESVAELRKDGRKVGFTSGAFDILHAGHCDYLEKASLKCDYLIVGINSDASVKKYKGPSRPIIPEKFRALSIAALESVNAVFIFDERRNEKNIREIKPDIYFKAGDYNKKELTSAPVIESQGGRVILIPVVNEISTSAIIDKITGGAVPENETTHITTTAAKRSPAVFLDRDGTINPDIDYLHEPEKFRLLEGAAAGMKKMSNMGYKLIIVTNQPGIGLGYYTKEDFFRVNKEMLRQLSSEGISIDKIYFCPHSKSEECRCRKPGTLLLERAEKEAYIDLSNSYFIGDRRSDMEAGKKMGMSTILITDKVASSEADFTAPDLLKSSELILKNEKN